MPRRTRDEWHEHAEATDDTATATHAAVSGKSHYVTHVSASHDGGGNTFPRVELKDGGSTIMAWFTNGEIDIFFGEHGLQITEGNTVSIEIATAGGGKVGLANIAGYTDDPAT